jgi:uncharacterized membrane protein YGL010W
MALAMKLLDPRAFAVWWNSAGAHFRSTLRVVAHHTGLPVVVLAAIVLVASWRAFRYGLRLAVEVAIALLILLAAARLGWIRW